ncbi:unnamed protein product [Symbiodinium necroappetens]|uniref:Uncharacterized protein n=1 Tax=Symbiodinium necroappetens TaxID=1628268 RepID=A0A812YPF6_9DINO|nr:unnamed protein product [Symbiodinium necroappetens]
MAECDPDCSSTEPALSPRPTEVATELGDCSDVEDDLVEQQEDFILLGDSDEAASSSNAIPVKKTKKAKKNKDKRHRAGEMLGIDVGSQSQRTMIPHGELQRQVLEELNATRAILLEYRKAHEWYEKNSPDWVVADAPFPFPYVPILPQEHFRGETKGQLQKMLNELFASRQDW